MISSGTENLEEAELRWVPLSEAGNCLEQADLPEGGVALRSSKRKDDRITLTAAEWNSAQRTIAKRWLANSA